MSASTLEVRLLGQFELRHAGLPVRLASRPAQSLLAYLILTAPTVHRRERLAGLLWPDATEANARNYLRSALWQIRKAFQAAGLDDDHLLLVDNIGLGFNPDSNYWLDALVLERAANADCAGERLMQAVGLYQGELLPGFYDEWLLPERQRLHAVFEQRAQRWLDCLIEQRRWPEVTSWSEFWIARSPTAEAPYRALMLACHGQRDAAGVAAAFERCRAVLDRELGVEPGPETTALLARLKASVAASRAGQPPDAASRLRLPAQTMPLIGREPELAEIDRLLQQPTCRLLTLVGAGGAGKSRLALEAAQRAGQSERYPQGVAFVPLAPVRSAEYIISAIAQALEITFYGPEEPAAQLWRYLRDKQLLLVLDSFEHLLASDGHGLAAELLDRAPGVRLLVTSRERLDLQGEWILDVPGLAVPAHVAAADFASYSAVQLFLQMAQRAGITPPLPLSPANRNSLWRICRLVQGLPLALVLAAAWVRVLSLEEIASEIETDLGFLRAEQRDLPERHRSLQAVFDHSWRLLSEAERAVFRQLAVFRGGFTREGAERVAGASLAQLATLVDKSLLYRGAAGRFEIHELLRQYAEGKLNAAGEARAVGQRHRDYCWALLKHNVLWGAVEVALLQRVEAEYENVRAALAWSKEFDDPEEYLQLVSAMTWFWFVRADYVEGRQALEAALQAAPPVASAARAAMEGVGALAEQQGDYQAAAVWLQASLALWPQVGNALEATWTLVHLGRVAMLQGEFERSAEINLECLEKFRALGFEPGIANSLMYLGTTWLHQGDDDKAQALLEESLPGLLAVGDAWALARTRHSLGLVALHRGALARALEHFRGSLALARERRDQTQIAECLEAIAWAAGRGGQNEPAAQLLGAAEGWRARIGLLRPPGLRGEYERNTQAVRRCLDESTFIQAWTAGRRLDEAQTLELALALSV